MIIWIDGTYGVGKTSIGIKVQEKLGKERTEIIESDCFYKDMIKNNPLMGGGTLPQNNVKFIDYFKNKIEEKIESSNRDFIIIMALTQKECKEILFDYFMRKDVIIKHFILTANIDTIKTRIKNDKKRRDIEIAINYLEANIAFLNNNYKDAIRIDTDNKDIEKVAKEIIELI